MARNEQADRTRDVGEHRIRPLFDPSREHGEPRTIVIRHGSTWQSLAFLLLCFLIIGGMGNIRGAIAGTFVLMGYDNILTPALDNWIQESGVSWRFSTFKLVVFGLALILMMRFRPEGLLPSRQRAAEMHTAPPGQALGSIGLLEEEGIVPEVDPTEPGVEADAEVAEISELPGEEPVGQTIAESRDEVTNPDEETPR